MMENEEIITVTDWEVTKKLWDYVKKYKVIVFLSICLLVIARLIDASVPFALGFIIQEMTKNVAQEESVKQLILQKIVFYSLLLIGMLVISYILDIINLYLRSWLGRQAVTTLRSDIYNHILYMPLNFFDKNRIGRLMTRTIHDVDQINQMFIDSFIPLLGNAVTFVTIFIGIFFLDWRLGIVMLVMFPLGTFLTMYFRRNQRIYYRKIREILSALNAFIQEHLMGAFIIRNFGLELKERVKFEKYNDEYRKENVKSGKNFAFFFASIDFLQTFTLINVFIVLMYTLPKDDPFPAGKFIAFSLCIIMIFRPLADIAERYNIFQSAIAAAERIFSIMKLPKEQVFIDSLESIEEVESIEFNDVWFSYNDTDWILKGVTFSIQKNESVALVGLTGEGKTTIISLLMGFYFCQKGTIKINDISIKDIPLKQLRRLFSLVLQDPVIFTGTIAENIALFNPDISGAMIENVVDELKMESFLARFKNGLFTQLIERGKGLSVGEMQLISMARALAHHRMVLMLDEATANIDSLTEKLIQNALQKLLSKKTSLVVAHRLSTIKDVSKIVVLKDGKVVEMGNHRALLQAEGVYEKLYRLQFA